MDSSLTGIPHVILPSALSIFKAPGMNISLSSTRPHVASARAYRVTAGFELAWPAQVSPLAFA